MPEAPRTFGDLPAEIRIEVKTARGQDFHLTQRDFEGIRPHGFAAILINSTRLHGPRWILVPATRLDPGTHADTTLVRTSEDSSGPAAVVSAINLSWSNWILDREVRRKLLAQDNMALKDAVKWCLERHPARTSNYQGHVRQAKLADALSDFRTDLDSFLGNENGPQQEGQIHQYILESSLQDLGYAAVNNPTGVPDIHARLRSARPGDSARDPAILRENLAAWKPGNERLEAVRQSLLELDDDELGEVGTVLRGESSD
jgi:uncharacterized protein YjiS (DUF1127 family)